MIIVPFIAFCFSAPVAMILCLVWMATTGHADLVLTSREGTILAASTALISFAFALLVRPRRR